jgi:hypothetical protein
VQSVLLYNSKWNLLTTALVRLEGFRICVAYQMAEKHKPKKGPHHGWTYPQSSNVLQECGMNTIPHYIDIRRATIFRYVLDQPIYKACREGERKRGSPLQQWWWEQMLCLEDKDADGANE